MSSVVSSTVGHYLNGLVDAEVKRPRRFLPVMADVQAAPESSLGRLMVSAYALQVLCFQCKPSCEGTAHLPLAHVVTRSKDCFLQDWLVHPDVGLAAYHPFLTKAGVYELQVTLLLQGTWLLASATCSLKTASRALWNQACFAAPVVLQALYGQQVWNMTSVASCITGLGSQHVGCQVAQGNSASACLSSCIHVPCCACGANRLDVQRTLFTGAMWLVTSFFVSYSEALAHLDINVTCPADTVFLTQADLEKLACGRLNGAAWEHSVQTALKQISLEDYYKLLMQRFPQAVATVGVYEAGGPTHSRHPQRMHTQRKQTVLSCVLDMSNKSLDGLGHRVLFTWL